MRASCTLPPISPLLASKAESSVLSGVANANETSRALALASMEDLTCPCLQYSEVLTADVPATCACVLYCPKISEMR